MTRCHDTQCHARHRCRRWLQREQRAAGIRQALTLKPAWIPHEHRCPRFIWHPAITPQDLMLHKGQAGWLITGWLQGFAPHRLADHLLTRATRQRKPPAAP
jgi:hypothetical protein